MCLFVLKIPFCELIILMLVQVPGILNVLYNDAGRPCQQRCISVEKETEYLTALYFCRLKSCSCWNSMSVI